MLIVFDHRFRRLDHLYWRNPDLDFGSVADLIASLEQRSDDPLLRPAPVAINKCSRWLTATRRNSNSCCIWPATSELPVRMSKANA